MSLITREARAIHAFVARNLNLLMKRCRTWKVMWLGHSIGDALTITSIGKALAAITDQANGKIVALNTPARLKVMVVERANGHAPTRGKRLADSEEGVKEKQVFGHVL